MRPALLVRRSVKTALAQVATATSLCLCALTLASGCVNLTPPWDQASAAGGATGSGGDPSVTPIGDPTGGAAGTSSVGGPEGGLDAWSPVVVDTGAEGAVDAGVDAKSATADTRDAVDASPSDSVPGDPGPSSLLDAATADGRSAETVADLSSPDVVDVPVDAAVDSADAAVPTVSSVGLVAYYSCEGSSGPSGTELIDQSGNGHHGTIAVGPPPTGVDSGVPGAGAVEGQAFAYSAGRVGKGLVLHATANAYVTLPEGLLTGQTEMTVAAWIKVKGTTAYQRVFDFGTDSNNFMYLATTNAKNTAPRFRILSSGAASGGVSQILEGSQPVVADTWTHMAMVIGPGWGAIYVNGSLEVISSAVTLRPADLGTTTSNYIGRSQFASDPYFDGEIDEYRIYSRSLSAEEIAILADEASAP
jgi:hypothetical protein